MIYLTILYVIGLLILLIAARLGAKYILDADTSTVVILALVWPASLPIVAFCGALLLFVWLVNAGIKFVDGGRP